MARKKSKLAVKKVSANTTKTMPLGVKAISILAYIGAVMFVLISIILLSVGIWVSSSDNAAKLVQEAASSLEITTVVTATDFGVAAIALAVVGILTAVIYFFVGKGLWQGARWARIVVIIYAVIQIVSNIGTAIRGSITSGLIGVIVYGIIGWYLMFSKEAKQAFR
jgi:phosphoglycerol transferase MdoB-like AlkP superfamily enzyme